MKRKTKASADPAFTERVRQILQHRAFFIGVAIFFMLQMVWIALSNIYPMLFDEEYHLGIIDIYSHQISPFIMVQPPEAAFHGDITRYSSYFFHYVMSFPYRLISLVSDDLMTRVIMMRFLCISLVMVGLWLFRKVLLSFGISRAITHASLLIFTLIPLVPFTLSQINYDALLFVLIPLLLYLSQKARLSSRQQAGYIILFIITAGFAAVTKFTVLPIIVGCLIFLGVSLHRQHGARLVKVLFTQARLLPRPWLVIASVFLVLSVGLVVERYGVNILAYQALEPSCTELHPTDECLANNVFRRNFSLRANYESQPFTLMNPIEYSVLYWVPHIFSDFFVTGSFVYDNKNDLSLRALPTTLKASAGNPLLRYGGWVIFVLSICVIIAGGVRQKLKPRAFFALFGLLLLIYSAALWLKNYNDYLQLGMPVAAQGRYYIWLLIPVIAMVALTLRAQVNNAKVYLSLFIISLLFLTQGGGVANYMLYSNKSWYWPNHERAIETTNLTARRVLRLFTPF